MNKLTNERLTVIWNKLDLACEALEELEYNNIETNIDFSSVVNLKNQLEEVFLERDKSEGSICV